MKVWFPSIYSVNSLAKKREPLEEVDMNYYLMFDVGGTKIKAGILTETGELLNNQMNSFDSGANRAIDEIF